MPEARILPDIHAGDEIHVTPDERDAPWRVTARDDKHIVIIRPTAEAPDSVEYAVIAEVTDTYNSAGPGLIRASLNTLGGGWNLNGRERAGAEEIIHALADGVHELSLRRRGGVAAVRGAR